MDDEEGAPGLPGERLVMTPYYQDDWLTVHGGDNREVMRTLPDESVQCVVTSPPYWGLRDYGTPGQLGLEPTPDEYAAAMVDVFREVRRVLRRDGTLWLNLGDSYAASGRGTGGNRVETSPKQRTNTGSYFSDAARADHGVKPKDLVGIPWRVAFALQADGWFLRSDIIWAKPNPMPESVTDRPTKAHEYLFLLAKSERYLYDADAIAETSTGRTDVGRMSFRADIGSGGVWRDEDRTGDVSTRNRRSVWTIATKPYAGAHFATFPEALVEPCILAGCPEGGVVMDPFAGTGTVGVVAQRLSRRALLIDLSPDYLRQCLARNAQAPLGLEVARLAATEPDCPHHCEEGHYTGDDMVMAEIGTGWPAKWEAAIAERERLLRRLRSMIEDPMVDTPTLLDEVDRMLARVGDDR